MLTRLEFELINNDINQNMGSLFHGVIMETIDSLYAAHLHELNLVPFSQYIYYDKKKKSYIWQINAFNQEGKNKILEVLFEQITDKIYFKHSDKKVYIKNKKLYPSIEYDDLAHKIYSEESKSTLNLNFVSATSVKSKGNHIIYPELDLILIGVINKINAFSESIEMKDNNLLNEIKKKTKIIRYDLHSTKFYLEKTRISSFKGNIRIYIDGSSSFRQLIRLLYCYAEYTGIGVKTGLGMGGIKIV